MVRPLPEREYLSFVPQGLVLGPLPFFIYISDLPDGVQYICKIFADDTSLFSKFSKCQDFKKSERELNEDLTIIKKWAFLWKMVFNSDPKEHEIEVNFPRKILSENSNPLSFNQYQVKYLKVISMKI